MSELGKVYSNPSMIVLKPWSDDEIILRIRMIEEMIEKVCDGNFDVDFNQMEREIATWKELLTRRQTGARL